MIMQNESTPNKMRPNYLSLGGSEKWHSAVSPGSWYYMLGWVIKHPVKVKYYFGIMDYDSLHYFKCFQ